MACGETELCVPRTLLERRKAYLQKAAETHPDKGGSQEAFQLVQQAYQDYQGSLACANACAPHENSPWGPPEGEMGGGYSHGSNGSDMQHEEYWSRQCDVAEEAYSKARRGIADGKPLQVLQGSFPEQ